MFTRNHAFSARLRRYRHLAKRLQRLLKSGQFLQLAAGRRRALLEKLRRRLEKLSPAAPGAQLKNALASLAVLAGLGVGAPAAAQNFAPAVPTPFGLPQPEKFLGFPAFADIDSDGDADLFLWGYSYDGGYADTRKLFFFENFGTPQFPDFQTKAPQENPFGIEFGNNFDLTTPTFGDLDADGDLDLMLGKYEPSGFLFFENTGSPQSPAFGGSQTNPFGLNSSSQGFDVPILADLDADGDLDLLTSEYYGSFRLFQNTGTAQAPAFGDPVDNPANLQLPLDVNITISALADVDVDGDLDALIMGYGYDYGSLFYAQNTGNPEQPFFENVVDAPSDFNAGNVPLPIFADLDADGDPDLLVHDFYYGGFTFFENLHFDTNFSPQAGAGDLFIPEDSIHAFSPGDFPLLDLDLSDQVAAIELVSLPAAGSLTLNGQPVAVGQTIEADEFENLVFQAPPNANGSPYAEFEMLLSDGDEWTPTAGKLTLHVTPVNDIPSGDNAEVTATQDQSFHFSPADFPFFDVDGNPIQAIRIVAPVTKGSLTLNGLDVTVNQNIPGDELSQMIFTPNPGEFGDDYATFEFLVADEFEPSPESYEMTIHVKMFSGTDEPLAGAVVKLSPNPATDAVLVQVETAAALGDLSLEVLDGLGRSLLRQEFSQAGNAFGQELDVSGWAAGVYFVKIQAGDNRRVVRLIKS